MKVLVADKFSESGIATMADAGHEVVSEPTLTDGALLEALAAEGAQVLIVRSTKVSADMMDATPGLELIVRAGAGYDTIDVEGASTRGIFVANCPGKNAVAVAELAFALILGIDRRIADNVSYSRAGQWNKAGCTSSNQSGPLRSCRKRHFPPLCRVVRHPQILSSSCL